MLDPGAPFAFFTGHEALTVAAAAARIFPTDDLGPGATEAGVVYYVDRALAGHDRDLQDTYRRGVALLDRLAGAQGEPPFHRLPPERQDAILARLETGADVPEGPEAGAPRAEAEAGPDAPPSGPLAAVFFQALVNHTREGMFSDPVHGGNRGMVGWRLLGHPGVQLVYTEEEFRPGARVIRDPGSLADFLAERDDA
ncbi:MAG TPA: gluconate 2-dehydrogenase subunit 3 family protein [Chloroflexota bacterium]|nr:gluconate 2-dehydrogenase subunit 3 family protein [Chloroflexota bacterium]